MGILLLAGPPAVGHNTVATLVAEFRSRLAVIDLDDLRAMVLAPRTVPWQAGEGQRQYAGAIRRACALARDFHAADFDVLVLDVIPPETLPFFRQELADLPEVQTVLLMAPTEILLERDRARDPNPAPDPEALKDWHDRIRFLQTQLAEAAHLYDVVLDNSGNDPRQTANLLAQLLNRSL